VLSNDQRRWRVRDHPSRVLWNGPNHRGPDVTPTITNHASRVSAQSTRTVTGSVQSTVRPNSLDGGGTTTRVSAAAARGKVYHGNHWAVAMAWVVAGALGMVIAT
jgi:hypothetical protein